MGIFEPCIFWHSHFHGNAFLILFPTRNPIPVHSSNLQKNVFVVQKQKDMIQLRDRVDHLDSRQRHQLDELRLEPTTRGVDWVDDPQQRVSDHYIESLAGSVDSDRSSR